MTFPLLMMSCSEENETVKNDLGHRVELPFSKNIELKDSHGNTMSFDLFSDDEELLASYSAGNYIFEGVTQSDIEENDDEIIEGEDFNEEDLAFDNPISVLTKNVVVKLKPEYSGYTLEEKWDAPKSLADRGFDWHWESATPYDYAKVQNKRCCAAIYATWYYTDYYTTDDMNYYTKLVDYKEIRGSTSSPFYGRVNSTFIRLQIKYRKSSHRKLHYTDTP